MSQWRAGRIMFRREHMALIKALIVSMAISSVWYGMEWMQYRELQWDRKCDDVVAILYLVVLWYLFAHQG